MSEARMRVVEVDGRRLTTATWGDGPPEIIMLHDGLGSISQWRDVPAKLAAASGHTVLAYDRSGHGESLPTPAGSWPADWLHQEAKVLDDLIDAVGAIRPTLVGHSDGGSIAAIYAAETDHPGPLVLLAAHSWLEPAAVAEIAGMRERTDDVVPRLGRFHTDPAAVFEAWSGVWTSDEFATWDIRPILHAVSSPTLVLQGTADEFATPDQATLTAAAIGDNADCRLLDGLRHLLHHDAPDLVIETVVGFLNGETEFDRPLDEQFEAFIDEHRVALHDCLDDLTEVQARQSVVASDTTLLGLVKHATFVEQVWFGEAVTGNTRAELNIAAGPDESFALTDDDSIESVRAAHLTACDQSRLAVADLELDDLLTGNRRGPLPLRWVYLHVLRELAQHCGHADILREQVTAQGN